MSTVSAYRVDTDEWLDVDERASSLYRQTQRVRLSDRDERDAAGRPLVRPPVQLHGAQYVTPFGVFRAYGRQDAPPHQGFFQKRFTWAVAREWCRQRGMTLARNDEQGIAVRTEDGRDWTVDLFDLPRQGAPVEGPFNRAMTEWFLECLLRWKLEACAEGDILAAERWQRCEADLRNSLNDYAAHLAQQQKPATPPAP